MRPIVFPIAVPGSLRAGVRGGLLVVIAAGLVACDFGRAQRSPDTREPTVHSSGSGAVAKTWTITELPQAWTFSGLEEDRDISGFAAWDERHGLVAADERPDIQPATIDRATGNIVASTAFYLLPGEGKKKEADAEGVVAVREHGCYYVTGSHGVAKKSGEPRPWRNHVFRIPVSPATGEPVPGGTVFASLRPWVEKDAVLGPSLGKPLQADGFNIEGLAWRDGKLWFGVRAPNVGGDAFVIESDPASIFAGTPQARLHRLSVGAGLGIREIAALREGFLVLVGEANSDTGPDNEFRLYHWMPGHTPEFIAALPSPSGKAEALLVLSDTERHADVLVVFDSAPGGGPKTYRLGRP